MFVEVVDHVAGVVGIHLGDRGRLPVRSAKAKTVKDWSTTA